MMKIGLETPRGETPLKGSLRDKLKTPMASRCSTADRQPDPELSPEGLAKALEALLDMVGLPAVIRPSFTLGGTGGGIAYNRKSY
jgi:carbamoylphosphate synthase large subunit